MRNLSSILFIFTCALTYGQNTYPSNGTTVLNSGENQSLIIRDGRSGINWNYLEWQFSNGTRDWVLGRRYVNGNFTLWREGLNEVLTVDNLGNVGIGTVSPYSKLNIMDNGISINASDQFNGGLIIQSNTGGRSQTIGAQLEFVIPANTDGSNMWGQGRIITVAGNSATGSASGKMILGTRRYWQKPGTSNNAWYYGDDITIDQSGLVGVGTTTPVSKLHVSGDNMITVGDFSSSNGVKGIHFTGWRDNTADYFGASIEAEPVWICCTGYPNGGYAGVKNIALNFNIHNASDWSANAKTTAMRINYDGNIGIGTTNPTQKLTVKGTVYSTEVKVDVNAGTGPDYVFEPTYQLPSLIEIENYIKANKHLPEVPSAKEMETNGINLSEMNMLLLKKVEELTLHMIEMKKEFDQLKTKNELQEIKIKALETKDKIK